MLSNISRILLIASTLVLAMGAGACAETEVSSESAEWPVEAAPPAAMADGAAENADLLAEDEDEASEAAKEE
jgi:hypothetical protein